MKDQSQILIESVCETVKASVAVSRMEGRLSAFKEDLSFVRSMALEYPEGTEKRKLMDAIAAVFQAAAKAQERQLGESV